MSTFETIFIIILLVLLLLSVWIITELGALKKNLDQPKKTAADPDALKLQLQAYERLSVLSERISLKNLLSRVPSSGLSSREMQISLVENIKQEYEYNVSQQIYIQPEIWKAVINMKEQNIYIINQLASNLPPQASAMDLNKQIVEFLMNNSNNSLHDAVHDAINYEAKKLM